LECESFWTSNSSLNNTLQIVGVLDDPEISAQLNELPHHRLVQIILNRVGWIQMVT